MSTYKITVSKNSTASAEDEHIAFVDSDTGTADVDVTLWVDDQEIHAVTLTDAGACLEYTGTLSEGYHTIKVVPEAGKPTDVHIDRVLIDDSVVVGSQYLMDTRIFGKAGDFLWSKCCVPFRSPKGTDHVWWGTVYSADYTVESNTTYYRPHIVTDLGEWWEWSFSVTAAGHIHWQYDDSDSILYDSTENHHHYAAKSLLFEDSASYPAVDGTQIPSDSTISYVGPGTYDESFVYLNDSLSQHSYDSISVYSITEWEQCAWYYLVWWSYNNVEPIVVS